MTYHLIVEIITRCIVCYSKQIASGVVVCHDVYSHTIKRSSLLYHTLDRLHGDLPFSNPLF